FIWSSGCRPDSGSVRPCGCGCPVNCRRTDKALRVTAPRRKGVMTRSSLRLLSVLVLVILVFVGTMGAAREPDAAAHKWNWLSGTRWYVPAENLLAYLAEPSLSLSIPVADQTLWSITEARDGHFQGTANTEIWAKGPGGLVQVAVNKNTMDG